MRFCRVRFGGATVSVFAACALATALVTAQAPPRYHIGRRATADEIEAWDIAIGPDGQGLPPGSGTAVRGKDIFAAQCARCHGATGREGPEAPLVGGAGTLATAHPLKTVGSYWPYATTLWDYVNRAMPFDRPGVLSADDVYATVAYVLYLNGIVGEHDTIDRATLPRVRMPNRNGFEPDPRPDVPAADGHPAAAGSAGSPRTKRP
jgi:mono/diheme cytochrome c family protein